MANPTEHAIEHGEHSAHAAHDPFDRRVTITIAIVAAMLACSTMLGHRAHNETLLLQNNASNQWNYFQSKKNRQYLYESSIGVVELLPGVAADPALSERRESRTSAWKKDAARYKDESEDIQKEARRYQEDSAHIHHVADLYDIAELGVELGVVFCSLALLTKRKPFWMAGILVAAVGLVLMSWGAYEQFIAHPISSH